MSHPVVPEALEDDPGHEDSHGEAQEETEVDDGDPGRAIGGPKIGPQ